MEPSCIAQRPVRKILKTQSNCRSRIFQERHIENFLAFLRYYLNEVGMFSVDNHISRSSLVVNELVIRSMHLSAQNPDSRKSLRRKYRILKLEEYSIPDDDVI